MFAPESTGKFVMITIISVPEPQRIFVVQFAI